METLAMSAQPSVQDTPTSSKAVKRIGAILLGSSIAGGAVAVGTAVAGGAYLVNQIFEGIFMPSTPEQKKLACSLLACLLLKTVIMDWVVPGIKLGKNMLWPKSQPKQLKLPFPQV